MRNNPDDLSNQLLEQIKTWLNNEVETTELIDEKLCESNEDFICYGRRENAISILELIEKWENENA